MNLEENFNKSLYVFHSICFSVVFRSVFDVNHKISGHSSFGNINMEIQLF